MKQFIVAVCLLAAMTLVGCGRNNPFNPATVNGVWSATLLDENGTTFLTFGTSLVVNGDGSLSISNFSFTTASPCFLSGQTENGSFTFTGDFNGNVTGKFNFVVLSGSPAGNTLTLAGTANGKTISGTWTLNGEGCTGSGTFNMTHA